MLAAVCNILVMPSRFLSMPSIQSSSHIDALLTMKVPMKPCYKVRFNGTDACSQTHAGCLQPLSMLLLLQVEQTFVFQAIPATNINIISADVEV